MALDVSTSRTLTAGRRTRGKNLSLLTASTAMDNAENSITTVLFPLMREALGLSSSALGVIVAVSKAVGIFAAVPWVFLAKRFSRRAVLATCSGFWGVWVILAGLSSSFTQFVILYGIAAAGFAGAGPIALEIMGDLYDDRRRGRATGMLYGGVAIITGVSAPLFGQLSGFDDGWRYGYILSGCMCILIGVLVVVFLDDTRPVEGERRAGDAVVKAEEKAQNVVAGVRELLRIRTFRYILVQRLLSGQNVIMSFGVVFLVEERGFSTATAAIVATPFAIGYLLGTVVGGRLNDAVHRRWPASGRVMMLQASQLAFAAAVFVELQMPTSSIGFFVAIFAVVGFLQGQVPVVNRPLIMAVVSPEQRALAFAVSLSTVEALAYAGYALLVGYLGDAIGLQGALLLVTVALTVVNGLCSGLLYRPYARDSAAVRNSPVAPSSYEGEPSKPDAQ
ncbi:MFS transporter [Rhodococcus opacus]|uniref:MFS transporter n=1 Tax=Rhodococcus opacus TaxID=37919 RepID=UPI00247582C6|nr:MFS transporter [Rhodococcus opacus]MDH6290511.1 putative MFS family arabinose efflux permease [Rhodococcus opacus]